MVGYVRGDGEGLFASQLHGQAFEAVLAPGGEDDVASSAGQEAAVASPIPEDAPVMMAVLP